jgi:hypothetical protein
MAHDHSGGAAALALAPGVAAAWSPARFGFSSYDVQISVGLSSKRRGAHGNAYLGQQTAQEAAVAAHDWRCGFSRLKRLWWLALVLLWLQEAVEKLHRGVLILLLGFNCDERRGNWLLTVVARFLGFFDLRMEIGAIMWTIYRVFGTIW